MEQIHGVDVSWLHRPTEVVSPVQRKYVPAVPPNSKITPPKLPTTEPKPSESQSNGDSSLTAPFKGAAQSTVAETEPSTAEPETANPPAPQTPAPEQAPPSQQQATPKKEAKRPSILGRPASSNTSPGSDAKPTKRSSWMSSLSSRLSAGSRSPGAKKEATSYFTPSAAQNASPQSANETGKGTPRQSLDSNGRQSSEVLVDDDNTGRSPLSGSFISSAIRRFSNNPSGSDVAEGYICPRQILNVDKGRDRAGTEALKHADLRRVSFYVDVEIAGSSRYPNADDSPEDPADKRSKKKEKKIKDRSEGEVLKNPSAAKQSKEQNGTVGATGEVVGKDSSKPVKKADPEPPRGRRTTLIEDFQDSDDDDEKETKKKDDADKAKRRSKGVSDPPQPAITMPKVQERPTTDPLRIYRRCCQLREAPVLKRISEQLGKPEAVDSAGVVKVLNLNRSRMQLQDVVCVGDWLAIVPVKTLLVDDANLTDEMVRILLAGLLASKPPDLPRRLRGRSSPTRVRDSTFQRSPGVIEKLTLKNNRKLTAAAWRHIALFLNLSRSIRAIDLCLIPFPRDSAATGKPSDIADLIAQSLITRHGDQLEEITFGGCGLEDDDVEKIVSACAKAKLLRISLAGNPISPKGLEHVAKFLRTANCLGLDIGGINLRGQMGFFSDAVGKDSRLQSLSVSNTDLDVEDLGLLLRAMAPLPDLRLLEMSGNPKLFSGEKTALPLLRNYLPKMKILKRLHVGGCGLQPSDVIGIAGIVPGVRNIAHLNFLDNPKVTKAATAPATDDALSEEACAMYASLMTAVRLSKTIVCVDIDVPGNDSSEVVRALARQINVYCLRNMELITKGDALRVADAAAALPDIADADVGVLSGILQDIGGSDESADIIHSLSNSDTNTKSKDYLVGGQGWVKALSHILDASSTRPTSATGDSTPTSTSDADADKLQTMPMTKQMLHYACNFRERLQAKIALVQTSDESYEVTRESRARLQSANLAVRLNFLSSTLDGIIDRFEREFPECRIITDQRKARERGSTLVDGAEPIDQSATPAKLDDGGAKLDSREALGTPHRAELTRAGLGGGSPRRGSQTDLQSFALTAEEAKFHRMGQKVRREILKPHGLDDVLHGTTALDPQEPEYDAEFRRQLEALDTQQLREQVNREGWHETFRQFKEQRERLKQLDGERRSSGASTPTSLTPVVSATSMHTGKSPMGGSPASSSPKTAALRG